MCCHCFRVTFVFKFFIFLWQFTLSLSASLQMPFSLFICFAVEFMRLASSKISSFLIQLYKSLCGVCMNFFSRCTIFLFSFFFLIYTISQKLTKYDYEWDAVVFSVQSILCNLVKKKMFQEIIAKNTCSPPCGHQNMSKFKCKFGQSQIAIESNGFVSVFLHF